MTHLPSIFRDEEESICAKRFLFVLPKREGGTIGTWNLTATDFFKQSAGKCFKQTPIFLDILTSGSLNLAESMFGRLFPRRTAFLNLREICKLYLTQTHAIYLLRSLFGKVFHRKMYSISWAWLQFWLSRMIKNNTNKSVPICSQRSILKCWDIIICLGYEYFSVNLVFQAYYW